MKTKIEHESGSFQPGLPTAESEEYIVQHVHEPNAPLTECMLQELRELKKKTDADISYTDIPELSDEELKEFKHTDSSSRFLGSKPTSEFFF